MNIPNEYSPETIRQITHGHRRVHLHVEYGGAGIDFQPADVLSGIGQDNEMAFNAVGSRSRNGPEVHYPVIDADGGGFVRQYKAGSKVVLFATRGVKGKYGPTSRLRDVLGDNGIELEVFDKVESEYVPMLERIEIKGSHVTALALRSKEIGNFAIAASTRQNHAHLYVQQQFSLADHEVLIEELGKTGVISEAWQILTAESGMGIVRTPWTKKEITHRPS